MYGSFVCKLVLVAPTFQVRRAIANVVDQHSEALRRATLLSRKSSVSGVPTACVCYKTRLPMLHASGAEGRTLMQFPCCATIVYVRCHAASVPAYSRLCGHKLLGNAPSAFDLFVLVYCWWMSRPSMALIAPKPRLRAQPKPLRHWNTIVAPTQAA